MTDTINLVIQAIAALGTILIPLLLYKLKKAENKRIQELDNLKTKQTEALEKLKIEEAERLHLLRTKKQKLARILSRMSTLLSDIVKLFEKKKVPTKEGNELIILIESIDEFAAPFQNDYPNLSEVCKKLRSETIDLLIRTDLMMRNEQGRPKVNDMLDSETPDFRYLSGFVQEANSKLLRVAATTSAIGEILA